MKRFLILSVCLLTVACSHHAPQIDNAQYWQRIHASESTYINGPKAQQLLNRDIARCVTELRELERLGQIKDAIPTDVKGRVLDPDELAMLREDTPERTGYLFAEHADYQDFEDCMLSKGWERTAFVGLKTANRAERNYRDNHVRLSDKDAATDIAEQKTLDNNNFND